MRYISNVKNVIKHEYNPSVQSLRGISILLVLLYHYFHNPNQGGALGVGLFFCISGYLITTILLREFHKNGRIDFKQFYIRRARRLLPLAYLVIFLNFLAWYALNASEYLLTDIRHLALSSIYCIFYVGNFFGYFGGSYTALSEPLVPFWSLGVEEQFYLFWPLLLLILIGKFRQRYIYSSVLGLICASIIFHSIAQLAGKTVWTFPITYFDILFSGCLIALLESKVNFVIKPKLLGAIRLVGIITALLVMVKGILPTDLFGQGYTLNFIMELTIFLALYKSQLIAKSRFLKAMGDMSYSLYCIHYPVLTLGNSLLSDSSLRLPIVISLTFLLAFLSHQFYERLFWTPSYLHKSTRLSE